MTPTRRRRAASLVAALVAVLFAFAGLTGCGRGKPPPSKPAALSPPQRKAASDALEKLQKKFSLAFRNNRSLKPLVKPVKDLAARYPGYAPTYVLLGQVWLRLAQPRPALKALDRSLALDPDQPETRRLTGTVFMLQRRYDDAAAAYAKAIDLRPDDASFRVFRANALFKAGRVDRARDELREALRLNSNAGRAHALLAQVYMKLDKPDKARAQISAALGDLGPDDKKTRWVYTRMRARMLRRGGDPARALKLLKTLPAKQRLTPKVSDEMARCMADLGQPRRAAVFFEQVLIFKPDNAHAAAAATRWRLKVGDLDRARDDLNTLRRIAPGHDQIHALAQRLRRARAKAGAGTPESGAAS